MGMGDVHDNHYSGPKNLYRAFRLIRFMSLMLQILWLPVDLLVLAVSSGSICTASLFIWAFTRRLTR